MELDADQFLDATIYDVQGESIGTVSDVYIDDDTGRPEWLLVSTGFFPRGSHVPLRGVEPHADGYRLPYTRDRVKSAPELDITTEELSEDDERALYVYYRIPTKETPSGVDAGGDMLEADREVEMDQQIMQLVERLFEGRTDQWMDKHEILDKAGAIGMPTSVLGHLAALPPGRISRAQVSQHVAQTRGTGLEQDILRGLEGLGHKAA